MSYRVMVTGEFPPMRVFKCDTLDSAEQAKAYLGAMFPHLMGDCMDIFSDDDWQSQENCALQGFVRDSAQAYVLTGNGFPKPDGVTLDK